MSSHRIEQVASTLTRALQAVLVRGLADPRIRGLISVTEIKLTRDLQTARVLISVYPSKFASTTVNGLRHATVRIQKRVNDRLHMKRPPRIEFILDERFKKQAEILAAIDAAIGSRRDSAKWAEASRELALDATARPAAGRAPTDDDDATTTASRGGALEALQREFEDESADSPMPTDNTDAQVS